jgi:hypothetical protein
MTFLEIFLRIAMRKAGNSQNGRGIATRRALEYRLVAMAAEIKPQTQSRVPAVVSWTCPRIARSLKWTATALQKITCPGLTAFPPEVTAAARVTTVPTWSANLPKPQLLACRVRYGPGACPTD